MRMKYYFRGAGIGIIVTTLILSIAFSLKNPSYPSTEAKDETVNETIAEANNETLEQSTESKVDEELAIQPPDNTEAEENEEVASSSNSEDEVVTYKAFTVSGGQSSNVIAQNLYEAGIVRDAKEFSDYMDDLGVDNRLQAGTFYVSSNMEYDDLVAILVTKQQDRDIELPKNAKLEE